MKSPVKLAIVLLLSAVCHTNAAHAAPILLTTFDFQTDGGGAPETQPRVELILQLPTSLPPTDFFGLGMGEDIFWEDGDRGYFDFTPANDDAFASFADHAADGQDDWLGLWTLFPSGGGDTNFYVESAFLGGSPDLIGYELTTVRLVIESVAILPYQPDPVNLPELQGYTYTVLGRYEFYGLAVPEPTTILLTLMGVILSSCDLSASRR